jgi:hypothetical protein
MAIMFIYAFIFFVMNFDVVDYVYGILVPLLTFGFLFGLEAYKAGWWCNIV